MKKILSGLIFLMSSSLLQAQILKNFEPANGITSSFQEVVKAYSHNYYSIQGEKISAAEDVDIYAVKQSLPGAVQSSLMRFHSLQDTTAAYQAIMYKGENYKEASKLYHQLYQQVKRAVIEEEGHKLKFHGEFEAPDDDVRFTVTSLALDGEVSTYKNFFAEIELTQVYLEWEVRINLHSRKEDAEKLNY
ncbi:MAG: hypothetical protein ABIT96_01530 [Ferruginibacter sp.]